MKNHLLILAITMGIITIISIVWEVVATRNALRDTEIALEGVEVAFADVCGLKVVECPNERILVDYYTADIINTIAFLETQNCKTGVGASKNNCTGIRSSVEYWTFETPQASIDYSIALWDRAYADLPIEYALAKWKTGNSENRDEATLRYINNFKITIDKNSIV